MFSQIKFRLWLNLVGGLVTDNEILSNNIHGHPAPACIVTFQAKNKKPNIIAKHLLLEHFSFLNLFCSTHLLLIHWWPSKAQIEQREMFFWENWSEQLNFGFVYFVSQYLICMTSEFVRWNIYYPHGIDLRVVCFSNKYKYATIDLFSQDHVLCHAATSSRKKSNESSFTAQNT